MIKDQIILYEPSYFFLDTEMHSGKLVAIEFKQGHDCPGDSRGGKIDDTPVSPLIRKVEYHFSKLECQSAAK